MYWIMRLAMLPMGETSMSFMDDRGQGRCPSSEPDLFLRHNS